MDPVLGGLIIQGAQQGVNGLVDLATYNYRAKQQHRWANEAANIAYNRQVEQWQREADYNSPKAQMARFVDAGLNPNLVYSGSGAIAAPSLPSVQAASNLGSPSTLNGVADGFSDTYISARLAEAQIKRLENQNKNDDANTYANVKKALSEVGFNEAQTQKAIAELPVIQSQADYTNKLISKMTVEMRMLRADVVSKRLDNWLKRVSNPYLLRRIMAETSLSETQALDAEKLIKATIDELISRSHMQSSQSNLNNWNSGLVSRQIILSQADMKLKESLISYYDALASNTNVDTAYAKLQLELKDRFGDAQAIMSLISEGASAARDVCIGASSFTPAGAFGGLFGKPRRIGF